MKEVFSKLNCWRVQRRHDDLVRAGLNPSLADVQADLLRLDGLHCTEQDVAALLLGEPLEGSATSHVADAPTPQAWDWLGGLPGTGGDADSNTSTEMNELEICCARSWPSSLGSGDLTTVIMYMPGGVHQISPSQGGRPVTVTVLVNEQSAESLESQREALTANGNKPFFSIQHNTQIAAFWPTKFFWDTRIDATGSLVSGVWAEGEWTQAGKEAVEGKNFRTFSPTFFVTAIRNDPDHPVEVAYNPNAKLNMGALENDPAFSSMSPLWCDQPRA